MEEKCMKNGEITISEQISETCTCTPLNLYRYRATVAKLYRYNLNLYRYSLLESSLYRYRSEPVRFRALISKCKCIVFQYVIRTQYCINDTVNTTTVVVLFWTFCI